MSRLIETTVALATIRQALALHGPTPPTNATEFLLDRREIATMASVFQPRDRDRMYVADRRHIATLSEAIGKNAARPNYLDRITVWWGGDRWYVIDGHHRLDAYAHRGVRSAIPCRAFTGSLDEAMAYSGLANSKDRLPMSKVDKLNYAWRLTLTTSLSKAKVARAASVSPRTVSNMRRTRDTLLDDDAECLAELLRDGWKKSDLRARGVEFGEGAFDADAALIKRADEYRERIYKSLGNKPHTDPEAFALALFRSDERLPALLMQTDAWHDAFRDAVLALQDERDIELSLAASALLADEDAESDY